MFLKRLELAGFKSFANRTVIDFEPGVTAVVGPNGSGKSNITEAVRWVLGEQSAKNLRGGKMPDIIFAGSTTRKPLNLAEVTIVLDNTDHYLPLDYSEVSVTRRYSRSGDSDFFINKQACRLKDIQELFMDSGLGRESFSIISQGKVEAIFSSKPEDRRGIFEEAAGVLKYKQRKKQAEQKLFETEDNLSRVQDIVYELEEQLVPLAEQKQTAKEFLALRAQLTATDVRLTAQQIAKTKQVWEAKGTALAQVVAQVSQSSVQIQHVESRVKVLKQSRDTLAAALEQEQAALLAVTESLKQAEGHQDVLQERSKNTERSASEYQELLAELTAKKAELTATVASIETGLTAKKQQLASLNQELVGLAKENAKYQKSSKELMDELRNQFVEIMQQQASTNNELKHLEREYSQEAAKNAQTVARFTEISEQETGCQTQQAKLTAELLALKQSLEAQRDHYQGVQATLTKLREELQQNQRQMYDLMSQVQQVAARKKSLQEIKDNYAGFYQGVRMILKQRAELTGIVGAVAELIEVPKEYTLAIETALGGAAQHVVVQDEAAGRAAITYLKTKRGGRATFLPLTTIKPRQLSAMAKSRIQDLPGSLGVASALVGFSADVSNIVQNLLGSIVIAKDLQSANAIAKALSYQYRVVSLAGDVMNAGGSMTGGASNRNQQSVFTQGQELQTLLIQHTELQQQLLAKELVVKHLEEQVQQATSDMENLRATGEQARLAEQEKSNQLKNVQAEVARIQKEREVFAFETREVERFMTEYETQKAQLTAQKAALEVKKAQVDQEIATLDSESDRIAEKRLELAQNLSQTQAKQAVCKEQVTHLTEQLVLKKAELTTTNDRFANLTSQLQHLSQDSTVHVETVEQLTLKIADFTKKRDQLRQQVAKNKAAQQKGKHELNEADGALAQAHHTQKNLMSQQTTLDVEKNRAELKLDQLVNYLQEEYDTTFDQGMRAYATALDEAHAKTEVQRLKRTIENLGAVNLNAVEQFELVNERHAFLTKQQQDLVQAKTQLFDTMAEMDEEVKLRFKQTFEGIRAKFNDVFPNMFGGGAAELVLTNPEDLLNTGIEIEAQPPGKKLQSMSLLSGGERSLTALALLFSIIQVRTVPFCILDEVEAALDEANVTRFGRYLSNFQEDSQFIVVTHRRGTMEAADTLYGVTMQESGVSSMVSVRMEDYQEETK